MFKKIGKAIKGADNKTVIWQRRETEEEPRRALVHKVPNETIPSFEKVGQIGVRQYEKALYLRSGQLQDVLGGGLYEVDKEARNPATEVIWVDTGVVEMPWGVTHTGGLSPQTVDGFQLGASGTMRIQIADPSAFMNKVLAGRASFTDKDIKKFLSSTLTTSFRDVIKNFTLKNLILSDREDIIMLTRAKVTSEFKLYGVDTVTVDLLNLAFPPDLEDMVEKIKREGVTDLKKMQDEISKLEKKHESEIGDIEGRLGKAKTRILDLEEEYAIGDISKDDYTERLERLSNLENSLNKRLADAKAKRDEEITTLKMQYDDVTKGQGVK